MIYFPTNWGANEPQNLPNHRVAIDGSYESIVFVDGTPLFCSILLRIQPG